MTRRARKRFASLAKRSAPAISPPLEDRRYLFDLYVETSDRLLRAQGTGEMGDLVEAAFVLCKGLEQIDEDATLWVELNRLGAELEDHREEVAGALADVDAPGNSTPPYNFYVTGLFGSNDVLEDNCFWKPEGTDHTWVQLQNGITNTRPTTTDPQFPDRTNVVHAYRNYSVPSGNACYGMQPSGTVGGGYPYAN